MKFYTDLRINPCIFNKRRLSQEAQAKPFFLSTTPYQVLSLTNCGQSLLIFSASLELKGKRNSGDEFISKVVGRKPKVERSEKNNFNPERHNAGFTSRQTCWDVC